jgi:hypothetical protein
MIELLFVSLLVSHHIEEGSPEHIAKTSVGVVSILSQRDILTEINKKFSLFLGPFAEYSFLQYFSIQGVIPFAFVGNEFYFSDIIATAKATPRLIEDLDLTFILSSVFPTGTGLATSGHVSLMPAVAGEFHIHTKVHIHLHSLIGMHLSVVSTSSEHTHNNHNTISSHKINYAFPHSEKEIIGHIGFMTMIEKFRVDIRPSFFFEDFEKFAIQPQVGIVGNTAISKRFDFLFNLYGFWALSGIRKGKGIGFIGYFKF